MLAVCLAAAYGLGAGALGACGVHAEGSSETQATLLPVRGSVKVGQTEAGPTARLSLDATVVTGEAALARLVLDAGPRVLVGARTTLTVRDERRLEVGGGRVYVDVAEGDWLDLVVTGGTIRVTDGALSVEVSEGGAVRAYVIRGEAAWASAKARGVARSGETIALAADGDAAVAAETLWRDWTGGLARPGPTVGDPPPGLGLLEARVPDEIGLARWPLVIRRLDVRVLVRDDLAITEVDQEFFNPASETVEGLYRLRVPEDAVLSRFAVDRDGRLVDGYVREKAQARAAYEAQVYRGSTEDPALLEWDAPGAYRARIYPIPGGASRRIVVRYAQWLTRPAPGAPRVYRYPLGSAGSRARVPVLQELSISADVREAGKNVRVRAGLGATFEDGIVRLRASDVRPRADFWMELEGGEDPGADGVVAYRAPHESPRRAPGSRAITHEAEEPDYVYFPIVLPPSVLGSAGAARAARAEGLDLVLVADVSAATDPSHLELGRSVVESVVAHLGEKDRVAIVTSDLRLSPLAGEERPLLGPATRERTERLLDALARVPGGGATDLGRAIAEASALCSPNGASTGAPRPCAVVYVGDGTPTVGELEAEALLQTIERLPIPVRLHAVAVGGRANLDLLEALTRGRGLALRVEERAGGAEAALALLSHVSRPLAQRVTVSLGEGVDNVFPRRPVDVVVGDVLSVVGRVRNRLPQRVTVRGWIADREFTVTLRVTEREAAARSDLRLRWAGERLQQLLLENAGRESIAELGTRYGLITPFTSFYVPSARELRAMGAGAALFDAAPLRVGSDGPAVEDVGLLAMLAGPLSLAGCEPVARKPEENRKPASSAAPFGVATPRPQRSSEPAVASERLAGEAPEDESPLADRASSARPDEPTGSLDDAPFARSSTAALAASPAPAVATSAEARAQEETGRFGDAPDVDRAVEPPTSLGGMRAGSTEAAGFGGLGVRGDASGGGGVDHRAVGLGDLGEYGDLVAEARGHGSARPTRARPPASQPVLPAAAPRLVRPGPRFGSGGGVDRTAGTTFVGESERGGPVTSVTSVVTFTTTTPVAHVPSRCSEAARLPLADRKALWRERLDRAGNPSAWVDVFRQALRDCETPSWADRRALLDAVLDRAGSISEMISVHRLLDDGAARAYLRGAIMKRVRTPADLRRVREAFGLGRAVDWALVEQVLQRATTPAAKLRALRRLVELFPDSFDLKLRLLSELEVARRIPETRRLAERIRRDPLADPGVRTAIGELYLRLGDEGEARRVFSEIVEFAPNDELARRRLGDLYRAHGWYEDAYRQYETLARIRPDDPSVLLLLAQAAAGAGRIDEALRLEQKLAETAAPGSASGLARTAILWSSVRFAELRAKARAEGDQAKLTALASRMRRSGVLREAGALRVSLVWSHPDAGIGLWASHPGLSLSRPDDIAPEFGIEVFDLREQEPGRYRFEVRRTSGDPRTAVDARLVVVWNEGKADERIEILPLRFDERKRAYAWTLEGTTLAETTPSPQAAALDARGSPPTPPGRPASPAPAVPGGVR